MLFKQSFYLATCCSILWLLVLFFGITVFFGMIGLFLFVVLEILSCSFWLISFVTYTLEYPISMPLKLYSAFIFLLIAIGILISLVDFYIAGTPPVAAGILLFVAIPILLLLLSIPWIIRYFHF